MIRLSMTKTNRFGFLSLSLFDLVKIIELIEMLFLFFSVQKFSDDWTLSFFADEENDNEKHRDRQKEKEKKTRWKREKMDLTNEQVTTNRLVKTKIRENKPEKDSNIKRSRLLYEMESEFLAAYTSDKSFVVRKD